MRQISGGGFAKHLCARAGKRSVGDKLLLQPARGQRPGGNVLARNTAIAGGVVDRQRKLDVKRRATAGVGERAQGLLRQVLIAKLAQLNHLTACQLRQEMNGNLLLPLPRVQRHRQPALVEAQRLPAGVKAGALGVVHGARQQGADIAIGVAAPDQMLPLNGNPVQTKTFAILRRVLAQRVQPPAAATFVENKLRVTAHQAL